MTKLTLLCVGDVVGTAGRKALRAGLETIRSQRQVNFVIANAENAAGGSGLTAPIFNKILNYGVDVVTLGDHIFRRREFLTVLASSDRVVRPANLPAECPGRTFTIRATASGHRVAVISLLGRMFMKPLCDCPYRAVDRVLAELPQDVSAVVVDFHAEATGEKVAMAWHLNGRAAVVFGTHTHVPTADESVLPGGTAYITDVGMCGPYDSVLGRVKEQVLSTIISGVPSRLDVAEDDPRMCGVLVEVDADSAKALSIERVSVPCTTSAGD